MCVKKYLIQMMTLIFCSNQRDSNVIVRHQMLDPGDSLLLHPKILIEVRVETKVQINLEPVLYLSFARENKPIRKRPPLAPLAQESNLCKTNLIRLSYLIRDLSQNMGNILNWTLSMILNSSVPLTIV